MTTTAKDGLNFNQQPRQRGLTGKIMKNLFFVASCSHLLFPIGAVTSSAELGATGMCVLTPLESMRVAEREVIELREWCAQFDNETSLRSHAALARQPNGSLKVVF